MDGCVNTPKLEKSKLRLLVEYLHILFIINFNFLCDPSLWAGNIELYQSTDGLVSQFAMTEITSLLYNVNLPSFLSRECYQTLFEKYKYKTIKIHLHSINLSTY